MNIITVKDLNSVGQPQISVEQLSKITLGQGYTQKKYEHNEYYYEDLFKNDQLILRTIYHNDLLTIKEIYNPEGGTCIELKYFPNSGPDEPKNLVSPHQLRSQTTYKNVKDNEKIFLYVNGTIDGIFYEWYPSGSIKYCSSWRDGIRNGISKFWNVDGSLQSECIYINDKPSDVMVSEMKRTPL